jgi:O-antigen ligase
MDKSKQMKNIFSLDNVFIFLFFVLFPFGQIIRIGIIQPVDIVVSLSVVYCIFKKIKIPDVFRNITPFIVIAAISWFFSIFVFHQITVLYGLLYLLRLISYFYFGVYVWNFVNKKDEHKKLIINSLLLLSIVSGVFGWLQFFWFSDMKPFFVWGWDMHLFRLVGTFLDPTFLGLIIVFGLILSIYQCIDNWNLKNGFITLFLLVSLAFTYSRASYLAFAAAVLFVAYERKMFKKLALIVVLLATLVFILPTSKNHSIELFRSFSALARIDNYKTTIQIFLKSPVFGIGYNNMCLAFNSFVGYQPFSSHACSGSDSSILFVLATTGVVGIIVLIHGLLSTLNRIKHSNYFQLITATFIALIVHSFFGNSMFYPWIMGWIFILLAEV